MSTTTLTALIARCRALCRPRLQEPDAELLRRFSQQRDPTAFEELLERYAPLVWGLCRRMLASEADCEEAFQATFLALVRKPGLIDPNHALGGWLHTVAVRVARKMQAHARRQRPQAVLPDHGTAGDVADAVGSRELFRLVDEEIERLPALLRAPLILCCLQGRTRDEAAETLSCSVAAIKSRLERGRDLLRRRLERRGVQLPAAFLVLSLTTERIRAALWVRTMRSVLHAPTLTLVSLAEAGVSAGTIGKYKLILVAMLLVSIAAGAAGSLWTVNTPEEPAATIPNESTSAEPKLPESLRRRVDSHGDPLPDGAIARLGTVRWRHGFFVSALAFSPDSKKIAAVGAGRAITLWDATTGKEIHPFPNNGQPIGVAFSPDGKTLTTMSRGGVVSFWDMATGKLVRQLNNQGKGTSGPGLAYSPDGKILVAADFSGTIHFWDPATGTEQRQIESKQGYLYSLAYSPNGKLLAAAGSRGAGKHDGSIVLWDAHTGKEVRRFDVHTREVWNVVFSPDGKLLASASWDEPICLWDPATGRKVHDLKEKISAFGPIAFSPDSALLAAGHPDGSIRLWDTTAGAQKRRWQTGSARVFALAFSPDGKTLASSAGLESDIRLWDVATGREKNLSQEHRGSIRFLRFSGDGSALVSIGFDRRILRWNLATKTPRQQFIWTGKNNHPMALSPDGVTLALTSVSTEPVHEVRLWDIHTGQSGRLLGKHNDRVWDLAFSSDGRLLTSGGEDKVIHVWDVSDGKEVQQIKGFKNRVDCLLFSPDGKALACGTSTGGKQTGEPTLRLWDLASGKERCSFDCRVFTEGPLAFSPDGKTLASGHGSPGDPPRQGSMIRLWDTTTGKELLHRTGPGDGLYSVAFSPDGKLIATSFGGKSAADNSVQVLEAATGRLIRCFEGQHSGVAPVAFSPDGLTVASGAGDSTILLWDITGRRFDGRWHIKLLTSRLLEECWSALADADAAKAYDAVWALVAAPEQTVPFLQKHLPPVARPDAKTVARLIAELDSEDFMVRQKATADLNKLADTITPALQQALDDKPSLEVRRRLQQLLDQTRDWTGEHLRVHRAMQVLEHIGTRPAQEVLQSLAAGALGAWRTEEAKAALHLSRDR